MDYRRKRPCGTSLHPPGFRGLREDAPIKCYVRSLPHWRQDGATYFVTFRLGDALPQAKLREIRLFKLEWEKRHPPPRDSKTREDYAREVMRRVEGWLDQGMGARELRDPAASKIVANAMLHFNDERYELGCFVVMPNHVHAVIRPSLPDKEALEDILQSWKRFSSLEINRLLGRRRTLWQAETFDRIIRDEEHLYRVIQYIGRNPAKAKLTPDQYRLWIRPSWVELDWKFNAT